MSVKERYNTLKAEQEAIEAAESQLVQAENEAENLRRAEAHKIWFEKKGSEEPNILNDLELMAAKLGKLGILSMIQDFTDCNISNLYIRNPRIQMRLTPKQIRELQERAHRDLSNFYGASWHIEPVLPKLNPELLVWENTDKVALDIRREHRNMRNREPFRVIKTEHVDLLYDGAVLTIAGEGEEFSGRIPQRKNPRIEIIESAFARAFFRPRIEEPEGIPRIRDFDYNTLIGASPLVTLFRNFQLENPKGQVF